MGQWSELPVNLLQIIEDRLLFYVDKIRIRAICASWNSHLPKMPNYKEMQFPWLLQALDHNKEASHALFNPIEKKHYLLDLPEAQENLFKGSSHGWVATMGYKHSSSPTAMYLINPLTRVQIKLPSRDMFPDVRNYRADKVGQEYSIFTLEGKSGLFQFHTYDTVNFRYTDKVLLSSAPGDDCLVVAIYGANKRLACCKLNDKRWSPFLKNSKGITTRLFVDIIFHEGKLYALNLSGHVLVFENIALGLSPKVTEIARMLPFRQEALWKYLVVSSDGGLIMVARYFHFMDTIPRTYWFKAFKLDSTNLSWVEVKNIGDDILFVGLNSSFSISSRHFPEYKRNHVYFTDSSLSFDTFVYNNREESSDTGVFNLEDGTLQSLPGFENHPKFVCVRIRVCDPPGISEVWEVWSAGRPNGPFVPFCVHLCVSLPYSRCREYSIFQSRQYLLRENGQKMVCKGKGYRQAYLLHVCLRNHDSEGIRHPLRPYGL